MEQIQKNIVGCFENLSTEQLEILLKNKVDLKFHKKEIVAKQGSYASHIIFIKTGYLKLYIESESDDKDLIINIFGPQQLVGLSSLFESPTYQYSVSCLVETEVCLFDIKDFKQMISTNAEFALSLLKRSHKSTIHAYNQMFNLTHKQLSGRVASAFLYLSKQVFKSSKFEMIISRNELANFTAMSTMSAIRAINDLKHQKIISDDNGVIEILNFEALEKISKFG
ncbi:MAG: Crp/Fnr family transcriptional regulator [Bacteroidales bacterium]|nr:Crp/Fnr family transcriptional regulator [Bacteroidales bacterium]